MVSSNTTPGLRRDFEELVSALRKTGLSVALATSNYGVLRPALNLASALNEIIVAASLRHATSRVLRESHPNAILITTSTAGALLPRGLLEQAGIRFDGLTSATSTRWSDAVSRTFERRCLRHARLALPYTERVRSDLPELSEAALNCLVWPSPVRPGVPPVVERLPAGLCYANDPHKKGLDLAVAAWARSAPSSYRLLVTGIKPELGQRFLRDRGIPVPSNVEWLGRVPEHEYRRISASVLLYVGASRVDQFATTQLEALMDGALLVTAPSSGPVEALELARKLDLRLVADSVSADGLASAIEAALTLTESERADYRARARDLLVPYSRAAFVDKLQSAVLPRLLPASHPLDL